MKNILVPTDFSDCAANASNVALEIAKKAKAKIYFIHSHRAFDAGGHAHMHGGKHGGHHSGHHARHSISDPSEGHAKNELSKLVKAVERLGLEADQILLRNAGQERILSYIASLKIDFVVMGSHGTQGMRELFIGSNTQRMVRESPVPVLVIKKDIKKFEVKNMVFASTFMEDVHKPFMKIIEFADLMKAQIHLLTVNMPYNFSETHEMELNMNNFLKKCPRGKCSINIYNALNEERGIQMFTESINADLIAITTHGKAGFLKMISHSITESLVNHTNIPVLSVNMKAINKKRSGDRN